MRLSETVRVARVQRHHLYMRKPAGERRKRGSFEFLEQDLRLEFGIIK